MQHQNLPPAIRTLRVKETIQNIHQKRTKSDNCGSYVGIVWYLTSFDMISSIEVIYQNLRSRFGIERYAYTETNSVCVCVCMYVCICKISSQTTEPICIKIIPANRASYADCYRLLRFEICTKYDEYCPKERAAVEQAYFANGNVLRDVIVVISVTIGVFRNNPY